jgi:peptidoglycan/LPS O-acetylase OafA/YrhL
MGYRYELGRTATVIGPQTLPGLFDWFAVGMLVAVASVAVQYSPRRLAPLDAIGRHHLACWVAAGGLYLVVAVSAKHVPAIAANTSVKGLVVFSAYAAISLLLVLPAVFGDGRATVPARVLGNPVVAWLGLISYGVFLYQIAVLGKLSGWGLHDTVAHISFPIYFSLALAGSVACAAASYYLLERPLLRFKDRRFFGDPNSRPVARSSA